MQLNCGCVGGRDKAPSRDGRVNVYEKRVAFGSNGLGHVVTIFGVSGMGWGGGVTLASMLLPVPTVRALLLRKSGFDVRADVLTRGSV